MLVAEQRDGAVLLQCWPEFRTICQPSRGDQGLEAVGEECVQSHARLYTIGLLHLCLDTAVADGIADCSPQHCRTLTQSIVTVVYGLTMEAAKKSLSDPPTIPPSRACG